MFARIMALKVILRATAFVTDVTKVPNSWWLIEIGVFSSLMVF